MSLGCPGDTCGNSSPISGLEFYCAVYISFTVFKLLIVKYVSLGDYSSTDMLLSSSASLYCSIISDC